MIKEAWHPMPQYDTILLRFGEITTKGKNRNRFEKVAMSQVRTLLTPFSKATVRKEYGRFIIDLNGEAADDVLQAVKHVFGISSFCLVKKVESNLDAIITGAVSLMQDTDFKAGVTFKVNAQRVWKDFPHSSLEMNKLVSTPVLQTCSGLKVDVRHPEIELKVEIRQNETYLYYDIVEGAGGYPLGTNGKALLLLSGGIDSPVAGWSAMRRGLEIECVHFHSYPFTSKRAEEKVIDLAKVLSRYAGKIKLHLVPFTEIQTALAGSNQEKLIITMMRRAMLRISSQIAEQEGALAIVTGDSLGQVASQTLPSMNVIGRATELPLLRPLVMSDKNDIIATAKEIGTYDLSILPYEDCCTLFVPKSPTTNPNLRIIERTEAGLSHLDQLIEQAVAQREILSIEPGMDVVRLDDELNVVQDKWF